MNKNFNELAGLVSLGYVPGAVDAQAPQVIFLQIDPENEDPAGRDQAFNAGEEITWCADSIGGIEVKYIRADLAVPQFAVSLALEAMNEALGAAFKDDPANAVRARAAMTPVVTALASVPLPEPAVNWQHVANEYADAVCNAVQGMRNVRDGIEGVNEVLGLTLENFARIQKIHQAAGSTRTGTVADLTDDALLSRAVSTAVFVRKRGLPAWSGVGHAFGLGSTYSAQLCRRFGVDPDEIKPMRARR